MLAEDTKSDIDKKLNQAIELLLKHDSYLLEKDVNERSISHKLAMYLQKVFKDWHVDCEYNRYLNNVKTLEIPADPISWDDTDARTVYPDIIIHRRGTNNNLLVVEIKKSTSTNSGEFDRVKLRAFRHELGYHYAIALKLRTGCDDCGVDELEYID